MTKTMGDKISEEKEALEDKILDLCCDFAKRTGFYVGSVDVFTHEVTGMNSGRRVYSTVDVIVGVKFEN